MAEKLLVVGSVAYDCIETPDDSADFILGELRGSCGFVLRSDRHFGDCR